MDARVKPAHNATRECFNLIETRFSIVAAAMEILFFEKSTVLLDASSYR